MLTGETALAAIATIEAALRGDAGALRLLVDSSDQAELGAMLLFVSGGMARSMVSQYGADQAALVLAGARSLILEGWQPPPEL